MKSGNQEQICVKLDRDVFARLELETGVGGIARNRLINRSIVAYTILLDTARSYKAGIVSEHEFDAWFKVLYCKWLTDPKCPVSLTINKEG